MGVAIREDGGTLGVFSPKKVEQTQTQIFRWCGCAHPSLSLPNFCLTCLFSMRTFSVLFSPHLFTSLFFLSILYLLLSHIQLGHEMAFDEQFDHFPAKVCFIEVVKLSSARCNLSHNSLFKSSHLKHAYF